MRSNKSQSGEALELKFVHENASVQLKQYSLALDKQ